MNIKLLFTILLLGMVSKLFCQLPYRVISDVHPLNKNYSDLKFLDTLLKEKSIVVLGENSHFDGKTLLAKTRIIEYLTSRLGFSVIIAERNMYEAYRALTDLRSGKDSAVGVFTTLSEMVPYRIPEHTYHLAKLIQQSPGLEYYGFDIGRQSSYWFAFPAEICNLIQKFDAVNRQSNIKNWEKYFDIGKMVENSYGRKGKKLKIDLTEKEISNKSLTDFLTRTMSDPTISEGEIQSIKILKQSLISDLCNIRQMQFEKTANNLTKHFYSTLKIREKCLGENLLWLLDSLAIDKKVIITSSSFHALQNVNKIKPVPDDIEPNYFTMMDPIAQKYGDRIYSIAFVYYSGETGKGLLAEGPYEEYDKEPSRSNNSLEGKLHQIGNNYMFLDLSEAAGSLDSTYFMQPTFSKSYQADWKNHYNAVFYIDEMKPYLVRFIYNRLQKGDPYTIPKNWFRR